MTTLPVEVKEDGKFVKKELPIPDDMQWLYIMLQRQTDALKSMRTMLQFFTIIVILGIIVQGCTVLLSTPLR